MNENENNINTNPTDTAINTQAPAQKVSEDNHFNIRSFNSYAAPSGEGVESTNSYPSVDNTPVVPTGEGTFYTPAQSTEATVEAPAPEPPADPALLAREFKKAAKRRFSFVALMIFCMHLTISVVATVFTLVYTYIAKEPEPSTTVSMIFSALTVALVGFPFMALTLSKIKTLKLPKSNLSIKQMGTYFVMTFTAMYGGAIIGTIFSSILSEVLQSPGENIVSSGLEGVPIWLIIIFTCIFPGIFEELIFRKLIIDKTKDFGLFTSVIFSGFTFAIFHGNFEQFFYALLVGTLFAYIYAKTGRIIYTIILHAVMNFFGSAFVVLIEDMPIIFTIYNYFIYAMLIGGIVLTVFEFINHISKLKNDRGIKTVGSGDAVLSMVLNPGMIIFLVVFAIEFAYMTLILYGG
ncbi:MAG: CPBP family intramembrane metalloprotease [Ruminococcaceae bacterium]|nr:CPBP family intramembrane metalloprotease [Oscillospiraceae bacterium]